MNTFLLEIHKKWISAAILSILGVMTVMLAVTGTVSAEEPTPWFTVFPEQGVVEGWNWPLDSDVLLTIHDPSASGPDYTQTETVIHAYDHNWVWFDFANLYTTKPGDIVTVSLPNGEKAKTHEVQNLAIIGIDPSENQVFGTTDEGKIVTLWSWEDPDGSRIETDGSANWGVDFDDIFFDLEPGYHVRAEVWIDGNDTAVDWEEPEPPTPPAPFIWADPLCECVNGWEWNDGDTITIEVFDQDGNQFSLQTSTQTYSVDGGVVFDLGAEGIDLQSGYRLSMTNGEITKQLVISPLIVKEMDPVANTISGIYDPNPELGFWIHHDGQEPSSLEFEGDHWIATFNSLPVDVGGEVAQPDEDGDMTGMGWEGVPIFMRYDIYSYDGETEQRITTSNGTGEYDPSWSPNGGRVVHDVVYWDGSQSLYITNVATGESRPLRGAEDGGNDATWSPNGLWIAFDRRWTSEPNIYIVPFTGGQRRLLRENAITPSWSPNGMRLVVQDLADGSVKTIGLLGRLEFTIAEYGENPDWSPDGRWIAYQRDGIIWKVRVSLLGVPIGKPIQITNMDAWTDAPAWSVDSTTIVFSADLNDEWDLWTVPAKGGESTWLIGLTGYGEYGPDYWNFTVAYAGFTP